MSKANLMCLKKQYSGSLPIHQVLPFLHAVGKRANSMVITKSADVITGVTGKVGACCSTRKPSL